MFDRILESAVPMGLPHAKAKPLLGMLVAQVFNPRRDGPAGFLQRLRGAGLEREVASWLGGGANLPVPPPRLEVALGAEAVEHMARKLELPRDTVLAAAAAMLPGAIHELSEHGDLPPDAAGIPERFHGWFGNLGDFLDEFGQWGLASANAAAASLGASVAVVGDGPMADAPPEPAPPGRADGGSRLLPWVVLVAAAAAAFMLLRFCSRDDATRASPTPQASVAHVTTWSGA